MGRNKGGVYVYQQMEKSLAEWLAEAKPIPAKVLCWESDTGIIRMGDGKSMCIKIYLRELVQDYLRELARKRAVGRCSI